MVVELYHKSYWPLRSHVIGTFQKSWSEWVALVDVGQERHICFSLHGSDLGSKGTREASLSISILLTDRLNPTAGRRELGAAKEEATKLDPSECGNRVIEHLKSVVEKINSVKDMLDEASQVCRLSRQSILYR